MRFPFLPVSALAVLLCGACGSDSNPMAPDPEIQSEIVINTDLSRGDADGSGTNDNCKVLWSKTLATGGSISHPALGKKDAVLYVASGQKVFALEEAGNIKWIWPDDDPEWEWPGGTGIEPPWELYTPALGREESPIFGTNGNHIISVNKNGVHRFALKVEGSVSGAPAISDDDACIAVTTDEGAIYVFLEKNQAKLWSREGTDKLQYPRAASQPLIGPKALYGGVESVLVLAYDLLVCYELESGAKRWTWPISGDQEATSNAIMDLEGNVYFVVGEDRTAGAYARSYLVRVPPEGPDGESETHLLTDIMTKVVSLTQGRLDTFMAGSDNAGLFVFDWPTKTTYWHFLAEKENFETVAQPVQGADGLVYFGAARHWLYVLTGLGEYHWHAKLETPEEDLGAILWPSSPVLSSKGIAYFHNGNYVHAVQCSDSPPADLAWPRFGADNENTGNIAPKLIEATPE